MDADATLLFEEAEFVRLVIQRNGAEHDSIASVTDIIVG